MLADQIAPSFDPALVDVFLRDGFVKLPSVFTAEQIADLGRALASIQSHESHGENEQITPDRDLWKRSENVASFIFQPKIAEIAAALLGASATRLIVEVLYEKVRSTKPTPWHRDSDFWSISNGAALTMWIPFQDTPNQMALSYVAGSHRSSKTRVLRRYEKKLLSLFGSTSSFNLRVGDAMVHHYRTLHSSSPYRTETLRKALAIHVIDADARPDVARTVFQQGHNQLCGWDRLQAGEGFTDEIAPRLGTRSLATTINTR